MLSSIFWPSAAALAAAIISALLTNWFKRGKPWVAINTVHRDDSQLIPVPDDLVAIVNMNPWFPMRLQRQSPLRRIVEAGQKADSTIDNCKQIISAIDVAKSSADGEKSADTRERLISLLSNGTFRSVVEGLNNGGLLPIPASVDVPDDVVPVMNVEEVQDEQGHTKAFLLLDGSGRRYDIEAGITRETAERTKRLATIFQYGLRPFLGQLLDVIRASLQQDMQIMLEVRETVQDLIRSRRLLVRAQMTNMGGSPENIEPYGLLRLQSAGKAIAPMLVAVQDYRMYEAGMEDLPRVMGFIEGLAEKQKVEIPQSSQRERGVPEYIVIRPGDIVQVDLITLDSVADDTVVAALEKGMLSCQLVLRRSNRRFQKWVSSKPQVLGLTLNPERRSELMDLA